tara:strand:+ start:146 stop:337 length:192 start_codon:yes stop_codon:yes gene_type:complete
MDEYNQVDNSLLNDNKTTYKKYAAGLGVTGVTLAAALLLAGRSKASPQLPTSFVEIPKSASFL